MPASARVARLQLARERARFGARVALDLLLIALGAAAAWLVGIWAVGTLVVGRAAPEHRGAPEDGELETAELRRPLAPEVPLAPRAPGAYALDGLPRALDGELTCPDVGLIDYPGTSLRLEPAARLAVPFREHVLALEQVTREVGLRVYGRAPGALRIAASYHCRPVTGNRERLSEHALGNALDVTAVRFDADPARGEPGFEVRVERHWNASGDAEARQHARFLRELTEELLRRNVFRTLLGPAHPNHEDHFHFDMAPHPYVAL